MAALKVRMGQLTPQKAHTSGDRYVISRALGMPEIEVDTFIEFIQDDDILLLCTRRLTEFVDDEELGCLIVAERLQESVQELIQLARKRSMTLPESASDGV